MVIKNKETNSVRNTILFILLSMFVFGCSITETNNTHNKSVSESTKEDYYNEKILGVWKINQSLTTNEDGIKTVIKIEGEETYLRSGKGDFQGSVSIEYPDDLERGTVVFYMWNTSTWKIKDYFIFDTIIDLKCIPNIEKSTNLEAVSILEKIIKELIPKGLSSSVEIIKLDDKVCVTKNESDGSIFSMTRKLETKTLVYPKGKNLGNLGDKYFQGDGWKYVNSYANMKPDIDYEPKAILKENSDAIKLLKEMIKNDPDGGLAYAMLGHVYSSSGLYKEAVKVYKQLITIEPDNTKVHLSLGLTYTKAGMYKEAIEVYTQAIRINPDSEGAHKRLGFTYGIMGMHKEAIEAYNQIIRINPDNADAYVDMGSNAVMAKRYKEAIKYCKQAIRINPDSEGAHHWLVSAYSDIGMIKEAIEACKQMIRINPDNAEGYVGLGLVYAQEYMYNEAEASLKQGIRIEPNNAIAHLMLGACYNFRKDRGSALEEYKILKGIDAVQANKLFNLIYK
jgi:tetratricopeptide (TPR) repeat protein